MQSLSEIGMQANVRYALLNNIIAEMVGKEKILYTVYYIRVES